MELRYMLILLFVVIGIVYSFNEQLAVVDYTNFSCIHFEYNSPFGTHIFDNIYPLCSPFADCEHLGNCVFVVVFIYPSIYKSKNSPNLSPSRSARRLQKSIPLRLIDEVTPAFALPMRNALLVPVGTPI